MTRSRLLVVAAIAAVAGVIGVAFAGGHLGGRHTGGTDAESLDTSPAEATRVVESDDAVEVAVRYVATTGELLSHSPVGRREILRQLVTPDALDDQLAALDATAGAVSDKLGHPVEQVAWVEAPLAVHLDSAAQPGSAMVSVWTVSVFASPDSATVEQIWRTVHVSLVADGTSWLVSEANSDAGPVPSPNELALPTPVDEFLDVAHWAPVIPNQSL